MDKKELDALKKLSANIRIDILKMISHIGQGHIGGSLSIVEVLSVLYGNCMQHNPKRPNDENRDRLVLSKGHAGPALYSTLANVGYFDKEMLYTLNQGGTNLPSHPDKNKTPGVDMTTGSLGQGISVAAGIAKGLKMKKSNNYVYAIVGDGELNEGQCFEAFQFIAHYQLDNCIVFIDDNKKQLDGTTKETMNPFSIVDKMKPFGFHVKEVKGNKE
ncbi:MAG: transketolase [Coprobacillaceae bacterium]